MREIVPGENRPRRLELPARAVDSMRELQGSIAARSQILWGEHCSECAYPACYASCAHYTPRPDLHCRRFEQGIEAVHADGLRAPLMRVRFRKWGKLLGEGPAPLRSMGQSTRHDVARAVAGRVSDLAGLPYGLRRGTGRAWTRAEMRSGSGDLPHRADAFVVECASLGDHGVPFSLSLVTRTRGEAGLFQERIVLGPGYSRHIIEIQRISARVDLSGPFAVQLEPLVEAPDATFVFGIVDFVRWAGAPGRGIVAGEPRGKPAAKAKCIVWDLDDTLWEGVLAEVGVEGVRLRTEVVEVIRALDARGILHSIASKNTEAEALAALRRFGLDDLFLVPQIGWSPKSESVIRIARLLGIGVDTLAFVDDQLFERSEVEETLGCVTALAHDRPADLLAHPLFDVPVTAESPRRRLMYRQEMQRQVAFEAAGSSSYDVFLRSCRIRVNLSLLTEQNVTRVYDLSQRTNQLNVTGTRYERHAVEHMARSPGSGLPIVMQCEDRFGDYGVIGFVLLDPDEALVVDLLMSCRVQRKHVEHALMAHLAKVLAARGARRLRCRYRRTERNGLALELLQGLGFVLRETEPGAGILERDLGPVPGADVVSLSAEGVR